MSNNARPERSGFTLVELLVSIAIIGILLALLLPAVQSAREAARATQCRNNLKQLALGMHNHESTFNHFPSNGWGYLWIGDPERGNGPAQPGGWVFQSLAFLDQAALRTRGVGSTAASKRAALGELTQVHLPVVRCPTRPAAPRATRNPMLIWANALTYSEDTRTDYAINEGDFVTDTDGGPMTLLEGDSATYPWKDTTAATGLSYLRSTVSAGDVSDGLSNTYLCGEKQVGRDHYIDGGDPGYDQNPLTGVDLDLNRWTHVPPGRDGSNIEGRAFGSAHTGIFHMALCDGSIRPISYSIDAGLHRKLGNRRDGGSAEVP